MRPGLLLLGLAALLAAAGARADEARRLEMKAKVQASLEAKFKAADKDGDGKLSQAEAEAGMPYIAKNFTALDTDKDGFLSIEELRAHSELSYRRSQTEGK